jgi:AcrR family transcriptional regulator
MPGAGEVGSRSARRTQEARSASTRKLVLDATIDCLIELGYSATTTTEIAKRAGVSRGAQLHHYPTKADLVAAAVEHLTLRLGEDLTAEERAVRADPHPTGAGVDVLWARYRGPLFHAWLELWVAARTDEALRATVAPLEARLRQRVDRQLDRLFGKDDPAATEQHLALTLFLLQGMALHDTLVPSELEQAPWVGALEFWKEVLAAGAGSATSTAQSGA